MRSKESFNKEAKLYDEVRPSYPDEIINWIISETGIGLHSDLLEIAPGTGQATKKFGSKGFTIHSVELGDQLAEILLDNCKDMNVTVDVSPFEEWTSKDNKKYDMIYCATAFHWLDPDIKYEKCADLLDEEGYLVLMWNNFAGTTCEKQLNEAYNLMFSYYQNTPHSTRAKDSKDLDKQKQFGEYEINESGYFNLYKFNKHEWTLKQPKENLIKGFRTQSSYISLNESDKRELNQKLEPIFERLDDFIDSKFATTVYICKKKIKKHSN